jgi:hypothetical protein
MGRVAIVFGSAANAQDDLEAARLLAPDAPIVCVNDSLKACTHSPVVAFATLHPERHKRFLEGANLDGVALYAHQECRGWPGKVAKELWGGTSGLFAVQIALEVMGFAGVICAGVPISSDYGTAYKLQPGRYKWAGGSEVRYRKNWTAALPALEGRVKSMSGWTRDLLGAPSREWLVGLYGGSPVWEFVQTEAPEPGAGVSPVTLHNATEDAREQREARLRQRREARLALIAGGKRSQKIIWTGGAG